MVFHEVKKILIDVMGLPEDEVSLNSFFMMSWMLIP